MHIHIFLPESVKIQALVMHIHSDFATEQFPLPLIENLQQGRH